MKAVAACLTARTACTAIDTAAGAAPIAIASAFAIAFGTGCASCPSRRIAMLLAAGAALIAADFALPFAIGGARVLATAFIIPIEGPLRIAFALSFAIGGARVLATAFFIPIEGPLRIAFAICRKAKGYLRNAFIREAGLLSKSK